jgi:hypothetical protein
VVTAAVAPSAVATPASCPAESPGWTRKRPEVHGALGLAALAAAAAGAAPGSQPIGRRAAQRLARSELSKAIYHPGESLTQRILDLLGHWLNRLYTAGNSAPGGWWALVALAAIVVIVVAIIMTRIGPVARRHRGADPLIPGDGAVTAREHRSRAGLLASAGDYSAAILESVRAIARQLEENGVLMPRAGRTADEIADEAAAALPGDADALRDAARLFDEVCYGQRQGTSDGYQRLRALDARMAAAKTPERHASALVAAGGGPR